jgi:hypothetical protein
MKDDVIQRQSEDKRKLEKRTKELEKILENVMVS